MHDILSAKETKSSLYIVTGQDLDAITVGFDLTSDFTGNAKDLIQKIGIAPQIRDRDGNASSTPESSHPLVKSLEVT